MINISENAARQIRESMKQTETEGLVLRIAARRLEDGSFDYAMGFDNSDHNDSHARSNGIDVVVGPTSTELLRNAELDYVRMEDGEHRFIFINPNDPAHGRPPQDPGDSTHGLPEEPPKDADDSR
jgi:iron-sulfur cluster assembly protein